MIKEGKFGQWVVFHIGKGIDAWKSHPSLKSLSLTLYCWGDQTFRLVEGLILFCLFVLFLAHQLWNSLWPEDGVHKQKEKRPLALLSGLESEFIFQAGKNTEENEPLGFWNNPPPQPQMWCTDKCLHPELETWKERGGQRQRNRL